MPHGVPGVSEPEQHPDQALHGGGHVRGGASRLREDPDPQTEGAAQGDQGPGL